MGVTIRQWIVLCAATAVAGFGCSTDLSSPEQEPGSGASDTDSTTGMGDAGSVDKEGHGDGSDEGDEGSDGGGDAEGDGDGSDEGDGGTDGGGDAEGDGDGSDDEDGGTDGGDDADGAGGGDDSPGDEETDPIVPAGIGAPWQVVHSGPELLAGVHANDRYIVVGAYGGIWSTPEGSTWTRADVDFKTALEDIASCNGKSIAVGENSVRSADGLVWENIEAPEPLRRVCCNGNEFVALSDTNIYTSVDGSAWSDVADHEWGDRYGWTVAQSRMEHEHLPSLAARFHCAPGHHVLVISDDLYYAHTPENWSAVSAGDGYENDEFKDVAIVDGMLVAVAWRYSGSVDDTIIWTSADGETWSQNPDIIFWTQLSRIFWDGEQFVALGDDVYTSSDATTWTRSIDSWDLNGNWKPGPIPIEILVGSDTTVAITPRETWLGPSVPQWSRSLEHRAVAGITGVALGDGAILAAQTRGAFFYTTDPLSWGSPWPTVWEWEERAYLSQVAYGPAGWVITGLDQVRVGHPGAFSEHAGPGLVWSINGLAANSERYVAFGYRSDWATSPDGVTWNVGTPLSEYTYAQAGYYLNGEFWMVGGLSQQIVQPTGYPAADDVSFLARSSDGEDWQVVETGGTEPLFSLAYGDGRYIAGGSNSVALVSEDGESWTQHSLGDEWYSVDSIGFNGSHFVAVRYGELWASYEGDVWESLPLPQNVQTGPRGLNRVLAVDGHFVGFGSRALIVTTAAP